MSLALPQLYSESYGFFSSHAHVWELDQKEGWVLKNWCFQIMVLEKILESPLDCKIKPVNPKGNQHWLFTGRTDAEAETPVLWPPDVKTQLIGKDSDTGKDWEQEEKGTTEDEMVGWHHRLDRHESEQTLREWRTKEPVHGVTKSLTQHSNWTTTKSSAFPIPSSCLGQVVNLHEAFQLHCSQLLKESSLALFIFVGIHFSGF